MPSESRVRGAGTVAPADGAGKPESPSDLRWPSWRYALRQAVDEFSRDQCTDLAAAMTYYSVLAMFPALLAVLSLLGLFGDAKSTESTLLELIRQTGQSGVADQLRGPISQMTHQTSAGLAFAIGILGALWSASGYVGAFGRAMNRIYEVDEGRPLWKLRPLQLAITLVLVVIAAAVLAGLAVSGPVAQSVGEVLGLKGTTVTIWSIVKWPVMLAIVALLVALLYFATPNVRQPRFRWISVGAGIAILAWVAASTAFAFYVAHFGSYNKTYGTLAGVVVFLLWLWLTNLALLFGAEVDAELERARELQAGMPAESVLRLPPRDTRASDKRASKRDSRIREGRQLRADPPAREDD